MDENDKTARLEANAYRNGVKDTLMTVVAHATIGVTVGRATVPNDGTLAAVAAGITERTLHFWLQQLSDIPETVRLAIFEEHHAANNGAPAPIVKGALRS